SLPGQIGTAFDIIAIRMKAARLHTRSMSQRLVPLTPIILFLLGLLLVFGNGEAAGQGPPSDDRFRGELEQTDQLIDEAKDLLADTENPKAEQLLGQAVEMQQRAWDAYHDNSHQMLGQYSKLARDLVTQALGLLQRGFENRSFVEQELERTADILDRARDLIAGSDAPLAQTLLEQAADLQERGREFMQQQQLRRALQLSLRARGIANDVLAGASSGERRQHQLEQFNERLRNDYEELKLLATDNEAAQLLLDQAVELFQRTQGFIEEERWDQATTLLSQAAGHLRRARKLLTQEDESVTAARALQLAQTRLQRLHERATELNTDAADDLLEEAAEKLQKAQGYQDSGDHHRVLVTVRVVMELLQRAEKILGQP
ncbi:MAG: hypothetical protein ABIJ61_00035, partial [bacterium]